jgi:hypothetical protein
MLWRNGRSRKQRLSCCLVQAYFYRLASIVMFLYRSHLDSDFYKAFIIALPLEIITVILYIKALKLSPLSLTLLLSLTPFS